jgi:hypothetical protein
MVENDSGLHTSNAPLGIKLDNLRHVLRKIEHDGYVATLPGKRRPAPAAENGRAVFAASRNDCDYIVCIARYDNADWDLAVVRAVGCVKRAAAVIETHLAAHTASQCRLQ